MQDLGFQTKNQTIFQMVENLEADGVASIPFPEFLHLMTARTSEGDTRATLRKVFALFDDEKTTFVSIKNLRRVCKELGETISEHELQEMIDRADKDNDGLVSEEEFYQILTGKGV